MTGDEMIRVTAEELRNFVSSKAIIGDPLDLGDKVIFAIAGFGFGFGAAAARGTDASGEGGGGEGGGAGAGVEPVALLVVHKDVKGPEGVQIYSLKKKGPIAEIIESIGEVVPPMVERVASKVGKPEKVEEKEKKTEQGTE
ncbi:spore germination protein GerW family protein [uncultured Methanofollis sp.]|uniref:spore germination protein GerW family protein n=1 Tax=uncultured Methanofollis sp. TaxID=262500 RepID=UPI0026112E72|nr:spore germination protein GerW family protein [uncultured Methanofollis sp.]